MSWSYSVFVLPSVGRILASDPALRHEVLPDRNKHIRKLG